MTKLIKQIVCIFVAIVAVIWLTTGSANAQPAPSINSVLTDTVNQVSAAPNNGEEANNTEDGLFEEVECKPGGDIYLVDPEDPGHFYQCSNGVPYRMPCPAGLAFNPNAKPGPVCDWPEN